MGNRSRCARGESASEARNTESFRTNAQPTGGMPRGPSCVGTQVREKLVAVRRR